MKNLFLFIVIILLTSCVHSNTTLPTMKTLDKTTEVIKPLHIDFSFDEFSNTNVFDTTKDGRAYIYASIPYFSSDNLNTFFIDFAKKQISDFESKEGELFELTHEINIVDKQSLNAKFLIKYTTKNKSTKTLVKNYYVDTTTKEILDFKSDKPEDEIELQNLATTIKNNLTHEYGIIDVNDSLKPAFSNLNNFYIDKASKNFTFYFDEELFNLDNNDSKPLEVNVSYEHLKHIAASNVPDFYNQNRLAFNPDSKFISLTFDDGPHPNVTPALLDVLKAENIKATFFLVGYAVDNNRDTVVRMFEEGHELANHTYSHKDIRKLSAEDIAIQIDLVSAQIFDITGKYPTLFRPPYAFISDNITNILKDRNMGLALWSVDPLDWKVKNKDTVKNHILTHTQNGSVILMHDIYNSTLEATTELIKDLKAQGYEFLTMSELLALEGSIEPGKRYRSIFNNNN